MFLPTWAHVFTVGPCSNVTRPACSQFDPTLDTAQLQVLPEHRSGYVVVSFYGLWELHACRRKLEYRKAAAL